MQRAKALRTAGLQLMPVWGFVGLPLLAGVVGCSSTHETVSVGRAMQHNGVAFLEDLIRLVTDDGFAFAILAVVVIAAGSGVWLRRRRLMLLL